MQITDNPTQMTEKKEIALIQSKILDATGLFKAIIKR